jgi:hypothetical protein
MPLPIQNLFEIFSIDLHPEASVDSLALGGEVLTESNEGCSKSFSKSWPFTLLGSYSDLNAMGGKRFECRT